MPRMALSESCGEADVGGGARVGHEGLGAAERRRHLGDRGALDERLAGGGTADEVEGDQPTGDRQLALRQLVLGMRGQARERHRLDGGMRLEELGQALRRDRLPLVADGKGA